VSRHLDGPWGAWGRVRSTTLAPAGLALAGLAALANFARASASGVEDWMLAGAVVGLGLVLAAGGAARLARGADGTLLAAGLGLAASGALAALGFTMAWDGRSAAWIIADALAAAGLAQAAWFALLAALDGAPPRAGAGVRFGLVAFGAGAAVAVLGSLQEGIVLSAVLRGAMLLGAALVVAAGAGWVRGVPRAAAAQSAHGA
jgi:hypothetical protein